MKILILFQRAFLFSSLLLKTRMTKTKNCKSVVHSSDFHFKKVLLNDYIIKMLFKILFTDLYDDKLYIRTCWIIVDHTLFVQVLWPKSCLLLWFLLVKILSLARFHFQPPRRCTWIKLNSCI